MILDVQLIASKWLTEQCGGRFPYDRRLGTRALYDLFFSMKLLGLPREDVELHKEYIVRLTYPVRLPNFKKRNTWRWRNLQMITGALTEVYGNDKSV